MPDELGQAEAEARIRKLQAETLVLQEQLSVRTRRQENWRLLAGIGGLATAIVALTGLFTSAYQWFRSAEAARQVRIEERLDHGLKLMGENSASARLAGVISVSAF